MKWRIWTVPFGPSLRNWFVKVAWDDLFGGHLVLARYRKKARTWPSKKRAQRYAKRRGWSADSYRVVKDGDRP